MIGRIAVAMALLVIAIPASAERRGYSVTSFERIIVNGPFVVRLTTGGGSSAYAEGDSQAIREIAVQVTGRTMTVRRNVSDSWGGFPGERNGGSAILYVSTPSLNQASVVGAGDLEINRMRDGRVLANLGGNGRLAIDVIEADTVGISLTGAGVIEAGGHSETGRITVQGPGTVSAAELVIENLRINMSGAGAVTVAAETEADITASGNGNVTVLGDAACINRSVGSGEVICSGLSR